MTQKPVRTAVLPAATLGAYITPPIFAPIIVALLIALITVYTRP